MPQLTLEFSTNVIEKNGFPDLFKKLHETLVSTLPTNIAGCKSRAVENKIYCIGEGGADNAFVHINLKVLPGRTADTLTNVGNSLMDVLKDYFAESLKKLNLQISIEISELSPVYIKFKSNQES